MAERKAVVKQPRLVKKTVVVRERDMQFALVDAYQRVMSAELLLSVAQNNMSVGDDKHSELFQAELAREENRNDGNGRFTQRGESIRRLDSMFESLQALLTDYREQYGQLLEDEFGLSAQVEKADNAADKQFNQGYL